MWPRGLAQADGPVTTPGPSALDSFRRVQLRTMRELLEDVGGDRHDRREEADEEEDRVHHDARRRRHAQISAQRPGEDRDAPVGQRQEQQVAADAPVPLELGSADGPGGGRVAAGRDVRGVYRDDDLRLVDHGSVHHRPDRERGERHRGQDGLTAVMIHQMTSPISVPVVTVDSCRTSSSVPSLTRRAYSSGRSSR